EAGGAQGGASLEGGAMLMSSSNNAGNKGASQAKGGGSASKSRVRFTDDISKIRLKGKSLKSGRKKLLDKGLTERINKQTGRHEFVDSKDIVRVAYDPISQQGKNAGHWHKWGINKKHQRIPLTDAGRITERTATNAHIKMKK
ncbi:MAG: hypothetical protein OEV42_21445, partial [Deltaproteobacteria bacterium]|nr:hypothetical protein [Deltaproteobacteria bacterium]